jgi:hypothetical protein
MKELKITAVGLMIVGLGYFMEWSGMFLYVSYRAERAAAIAAALVLVTWGIVVSRGEHWRPVVVAIAIAIVIGALGWRLEVIRSSPRREFYLAAVSITPGMSVNEARSVMAAYRRFVISDSEESFRFRSSVDTEDALIIRFDSGTNDIVSTELDLD